MQVAGQPVVSYTYDNANRRTSLTLPCATGAPVCITASYSYDNDSRLTGITYQFGSNTLGNLSYAYDQLGRRTQVSGSFGRTGLPGVVTSATYDAANELINWNGLTLSYDQNGNMLGDGTNAFSWNARNQVVKLNNVSLQYDAFGRRTQNASGTSFLYDGANAAQELSGNSVTANLLNGGIDEVFTRTDSSGSFAQLKDALGSTIALVDSNGNIQTSYTYDPYGGTSVTGTPNGNEFQYTGRENEGNGLYFYRARYYSPLLGRFISEDPMGFAGSGPNFYAYVGDDPIRFRDPNGLSRECPIPSMCLGEPGAAQAFAGRKNTLHWWDDFWYSFFHDFSVEGPNGKPLCVATWAESAIDEFNPFNTNVDDMLEDEFKDLLEGLRYYYTAQAVNYALLNGLSYPMRSAIVRGLLERGGMLAEKGIPLAAVGFADYKLFNALDATLETRSKGECYASFLPMSDQ
jgi:RHS repeat-associated protein